ncbi:DUF4030 domain-containing protein [Alkalihalobacillus sp. AL-G]|uniref:DUF4030 domain-containing protein n=1 Tax=Alkalihalobacillus sp. AL-G TaxID=2926399 RepID=UPI002729B727|nr:DUF4030 domain-containing protein [Alkalihalobacillus sp. AL-G]WLD94298.1 DUF4030 domain-containing protein [Alkalihalobacillus sp. AL-G]
MNEYLSSNVKKEVDKIKIPEDKLDQTIEHGLKRGNKSQRGLGKKVLYTCSAAVLLFSILIGSAFVSPAMAKIVSKIPYLGQIFESKDDIVKVISKELRAKGYNTSGAGVSFPEKEIYIGIKGSEKYFDTVKGDVETIVKDILHSRNYDAYTLKVSRYKERKVEIDKKEEKEMKEFYIISTVITKELKKQNYNVLTFSMGHNPKTIKLEIPNTETRIDEMKQVINDVLQTNKIDPIPLNIKKIDMKKREQDKRWREILDIVEDDILGKKEYKVRMVGYSIHPEPEIQAFITLPSSDENAKAFAQQLEKVIDDFLKSEEMKSKVKNDPYHITIFSKDDKIIN